ncbi:MAG: L,D-transpeptidase family protein [Planctomycetes bacterium]|nr:L,D-transpeptidase family protein [Planctomycetota bacterium]
MARYPSSSYGRRKRRNRKWILNISALLIAAVVIAFLYGPLGKSNDKTPDITTDTGTETQIVTEQQPVPPKPNLSELPPEPTDESNPKVTELISEAMEYLNATPSGVIEARDRLNETLPIPMSTEQQAFVKNKLSELADQWLFTRTIHPQDGLCGTYKVQPGDLLMTIGKKFKVPYEAIMEINKISRPQSLQAGDVIKVINGPFHARIYRSTFTMDLYLQNTFVRSFPVGLGRPGRETPTGLWRVKPNGKLISPTWTDPDTGRRYLASDPDYPLGSRWIALEGIKGDAVGREGFAIHGTKEPGQIGTVTSRGCIRLHNGNAILVYNLLASGLSQVEVVD